MERHVVAQEGELSPGQRKIIEVGGRKIGVFNIENRLYAIANRCPHAGGPLCFGDVSGTTRPGEEHYELEWVDEGRILRCPWHAWEFSLLTGAAVGDSSMKVATYKVVCDGGTIFVEA